MAERGHWRGRHVDAGRAWENHYPIKWEESSVVDQVRIPEELLLKEALHGHIQMTRMEDWSFLTDTW